MKYKNQTIKAFQFHAFDRFPKEIQDALNYSNVGFTAKDICYLYSLYYNKTNTSEEIVEMINAKDAFITLLGPFGRKLV